MSNDVWTWSINHSDNQYSIQLHTGSLRNEVKSAIGGWLLSKSIPGTFELAQRLIAPTAAMPAVLEFPITQAEASDLGWFTE